MPFNVLVVDDQEQPRRLLSMELREAGFEVAEAADGEDGWRTFDAHRPDVVVTDMVMPRCDGLELLKRIRAASDVPVIVFTGHGSVESAAHAFKAGADDFVSSLEVDIDHLVELVRSAAMSPHAPPHPDELEQRLVGDSPEMGRARWQIAGLAPLATPVLVTGEQGTGRSTAVRALHELGSTSERELFRYEAAKFEAPAESPGRSRERWDAEGGAVHLEDIEYLPHDAQVYWAKRISKGGFEEGETRLFATTAAPMDSLVRSGVMDSELGRTLLRFHVELPPLRARRSDIPAVAKSLLRRLGTSVGRTRVQLSPAALKFLETTNLPGNVRQLERVLERAIAYSRDRTIRRQTIQDLLADLEDSIARMREERASLERQRLINTLRETGGNITHTADALGKSRAAVYRMITKHQIPLTRRG